MAINRRIFIRNIGLATGYNLLPYSHLFANSQYKKLGVCLVGLGNYSASILAPSLQSTKHCELKRIVTGTLSKIPVWWKKYGISDKNIYSYNTMHEIANNPDIDVIYIVLPTGLHAEYTIKAANTGKHVWCENLWQRQKKNAKLS